MLLHKEDTAVLSEGVESSVSFGIDESQLGLVFDILRSKIYSDPVLAVVRELSSNAKDAHAGAKISDRPIVVTLPTASNPTFIVQDFGKGMSPELINTVYRNYGSSLKTGDNSQIGGFGLGSKSPFALTDSFTINTVHEGIEYFYSAFIDESNVGTIVLFESIPTDSPSGTTIRVPVSKEKIHDFERRLIEVTEYWTVRPEVTNKGKLNYDNTPIVEEGVAQNCRWQLQRGGGWIKVLIGEIPYRIEESHFRINGSREENLLRCPLLLSIPIGSVDLAVSRESIQYTERSKEALKRFLSSAFESIKSRIQETLNTKKSYKEAAVYLYGAIDYHLQQSHPFTYQGKPMSPVVKYEQEATSYVMQSSGKYTKVSSWRKELRIYSRADRASEFVINDTGRKRITGIQSFLDRLGSSLVYWFELPEGMTVERFIEENPILGPEVLDAKRLSEIYTIPKTVRSKVVKEKGTITAYQFTASPYYISKGSFYGQSMKTTVNTEDKGIYLVLEGKEGSGVESLFGKNCISLSEVNNAVKVLGESAVVYGIPKASVEKLGEGWVHLSKALNQKIEENLLKRGITADGIKEIINLSVDKEMIEGLSNFVSTRYCLLKKYHSLLENREIVVDRFFNLSRRVIALNNQYSRYSSFLDSLKFYTHFFDHDPTFVNIFKQELAKFNEAFPLMDRVIGDDEEKVIHYIRACNSFAQ